MAAQAHTTRRALFAAGALLPALPAVAHAAPKTGMSWTTFVNLMGSMHRHGKAAALFAHEAGMRLEDLRHISLGRGGVTVRFFDEAKDKLYCFDQRGQREAW